MHIWKAKLHAEKYENQNRFQDTSNYFYHSRVVQMVHSDFIQKSEYLRDQALVSFTLILYVRNSQVLPAFLK